MARDRLALVTFPRLAAATTAATLSLVALGVYTAATGSGLACSAQWPLCSGGVLPHTLPSVIEWSHRLVAMLTGFLILATAVWAWRAPESDRRTALTATAAAALLPLQVGIGAVTVTLSGLVPGGYSVPAQAAHLFVALGIFTALTVTTLRTRPREVPPRRVRHALLAVLVALAVATPASRVVPTVPYLPAAQAVFVGTTLAGYAASLAVVRWLRDRPAERALAGLAAGATLGTLLFGRDLVYYTPSVRLLNAATVVVAGGAAALALYRLRDSSAGADVESAVEV